MAEHTAENDAVLNDMLGALGKAVDAARAERKTAEKDAACTHPDFDAQVIVTRLEDSGLFTVDVKVWCKACALPFEFPESVPIGLDLHGIARSLSGQELRVAIAPATWPDDWSDRPIPPGNPDSHEWLGMDR